MTSTSISRSLTRLPSRSRALLLQHQLQTVQRQRKAVASSIRHVSQTSPPPRRSNAVKYPAPPTGESQPVRKGNFSFNREELRKALKENPIAGWFAILSICFCISLFILLTIREIWISSLINHNFPETVVKPLRKALYFTNVRFDPQRALKFYKQTLIATQEAGLHSLSDEVLGLKLHIGWFFEEKVNHPELAIPIYEHAYEEIGSWLEKEGEQNRANGHRTRLLLRYVRTAVKLGQLYALPQVKRFDDSEAILTLATEMVLKERKRREEEGELEKEGEFLSNDEVGASLEALAQNFSSRNKHELATPLYLHALQLCPPNSCHAVILMNNLASAIAQMPAPTGVATDFPTPQRQAEMWAEKALVLADTIPAADRTDECTTGCATAKANLGELAEQAKRFPEALKLFKEAHELSRSVGFGEGVQMASLGQQRVERAIKGQSER
ncbi:hypothetical protein BT63DRAFT_449125 [Microthyrium microscopicum]|uniref:Uncharacterized protein n=1 Tax=Microthyrium microscopicum TaxID=703497 RepID=A0A6A6URU6_9PEZI|nr:hypothetical protein BT63DRAFT_449125 [Microthyrium microscopicum]